MYNQNVLEKLDVDVKEISPNSPILVVNNGGMLPNKTRYRIFFLTYSTHSSQRLEVTTGMALKLIEGLKMTLEERILRK